MRTVKTSFRFGHDISGAPTYIAMIEIGLVKT